MKNINKPSIVSKRRENVYEIIATMPPIDHTGEYTEVVRVAAASILGAMDVYQRLYPDFVEAGIVNNVSLIAEDVEMLT